MYPYWCVEKGYARFTGKREDAAEWRRRARGWVRVMHLDIIASMFIYTIATVAFYLLGAGVLHGMKLVPKDDEMISTLSHIYTQTLGGWAVWLFYAGAIVTLYGTIFAATAANARVFADMFRLMGFFATDDYERRKFWRNFFIIALNVIGIALYFLFKNPVQMVVAGGIAQSLMLPVLGIGTVYLRHRRLPPEIAPSIVTTIFLWIATIVIVCLMSYYVWLRLTQA
jgi:Mn2+/Fe2+ NRAMP family transporter